jgi:V/A-type H+-transporting ATPase subunit I
MIVPMKKVRVFVRPESTKSATEQLKAFGLLHPELQSVQSQTLDQIRSETQRVELALTLVPQSKDPLVSISSDLEDRDSLLSRILQAGQDIEDLENQIEFLQQEIQRVTPWGNFDPSLVDFIRDKGLDPRFLLLTKEQLTALPNDLRYILLETGKTQVRILLLDQGTLPSDIEPFDLPALSKSQMEENITQLKGRIDTLNEYLQDFIPQRSVLETYLSELQDLSEFQLVQENIVNHGVAAVITGYMPAEHHNDLKSIAAKNHWALIVSDPDEDDQVPTLTRNPKAVSIIQPVFNLLDTVPGYREKDISIWFLMFFTVFFAMIIGDAAYGVILLVLSMFLAGKSKKSTGKVPDGIILLSVLSTATVIWGAITGNWFGYEPIGQLPGFRSLIIPGINSFDPASVQMVQWLCFIIGTVHIVLGHTLQIIDLLKKKLAFKALSQLGWLVTVLGLYFLVLNVVIGDAFPIPDYALGMIIGGMVGVFLFENQENDGFVKGIVRSLGGLIPTALSGVSSFSDIISYIRLFAVGLSSLKIAESFNAMGGGMFESGVGGIIAGALVIAFGHTLNLAMAGLSVVVHGVRLNMLEFSSHAGNEWAGFAFKPFGSKT